MKLEVHLPLGASIESIAHADRGVIGVVAEIKVGDFGNHEEGLGDVDLGVDESRHDSCRISIEIVVIHNITETGMELLVVGIGKAQLHVATVRSGVLEGVPRDLGLVVVVSAREAAGGPGQAQTAHAEVAQVGAIVQVVGQVKGFVLSKDSLAMGVDEVGVNGLVKSANFLIVSLVSHANTVAEAINFTVITNGQFGDEGICQSGRTPNRISRNIGGNGSHIEAIVQGHFDLGFTAVIQGAKTDEALVSQNNLVREVGIGVVVLTDEQGAAAKVPGSRYHRADGD